jgi:DNA-binding NarL/FixJ family response regulator
MTLPPRLTIPLAEWIDTAAPGDSVIVQTSPHNGNREVADARDAGLITTAQKRAGGAFHLIAIRTSGKVKPQREPSGRGHAGSEHIGHKRRVSVDDPVLREKVIALRADGCTYDDIIARLHISHGTIVRIMRDHREAAE